MDIGICKLLAWKPPLTFSFLSPSNHSDAFFSGGCIHPFICLLNAALSPSDISPSVRLFLSCLCDGQMVGISSVSGRHLGTPKSRVVNFWLDNTWFILFLSLQFYFICFWCLFSLKPNVGGGSGSELDPSPVTSWDCCRFLRPAPGPLSPGVLCCAPDSKPCLCSLVVVWEKRKGASCCGQWYGELEAEGVSSQGVSVLNQFEDFYILAFWS